MAKVKICDHCKKIETHLHDACFREYYVGCEFDFGHVFPVDTKRVVRIDLCADCYSKLLNMKKE